MSKRLNDYLTLGRSGLRVSPVSLGTMTFGDDWGWGAAEAESRRMLDIYMERGGNFIDTANFYTGGTSETLLGRFLAGRRDNAVIATKYSLNTEPAIRTPAATTAATWSARWKRACAVSIPTTSTSITCMSGTG